ncbi:hypothetical protein HHL28_14995 [Aerophototrophica crusticola]|uniref:Sporulation protein YtfJ n=1 Tax=Aerophototrophica crusticola TaxID=1709002 RepID=A0A858RAQ8_9PROT|nr:hypothetical protein HHL28_14995 [Rhodospirillaceae bacterium B3]
MFPNPFTSPSDPVETIMTTTLREFEAILGKGVTGTPITVGDVTLIPLFSTTFGVGVGGGSVLGEPVGGGGGGGVVPCGVIVVGPDGVSLQTVNSGAVAATAQAHAQLAATMAEQGRTGKVKAAAPALALPVTG